MFDVALSPPSSTLTSRPGSRLHRARAHRTGPPGTWPWVGGKGRDRVTGRGKDRGRGRGRGTVNCSCSSTPNPNPNHTPGFEASGELQYSETVSKISLYTTLALTPPLPLTLPVRDGTHLQAAAAKGADPLPWAHRASMAAGSGVLLESS